MKTLFDKVSSHCSQHVTRAYSTSFSMGIQFLGKPLHDPVYSIYGFVRLADEIVDSFLNYNQAYLLNKFKQDTIEAIEQKISLNPILNSFQKVVHDYSIEWSLIETFLNSMEMDLHQQDHSKESYIQYIIGSAEVVGLMCLRVFAGGDTPLFNTLKPSAMKLGAAFQKVNFLRDIKADYQELGRTYFPGVNFELFTQQEKEKIQEEIALDFNEGLKGIKQLPRSSRMGVYLAYIYYLKLFNKIKKTPAEKVMKTRIRIPDIYKIGLLFQTMIRLKLNLL